jgi:hypothetical protein
MPDTIAPVRIWVLNDFDPWDLPPKWWRYSDAIRYVVGLVATRSLRRRWRKINGGWTPLRQRVIARLFGRSGVWQEIRRGLLNLGILHCDEKYEIGRKAKWYRLGAAWRGKGVSQLRVTDKRLLAHLNWQSFSQLRRRTEVHIHLAGWLREVRVDDREIRRWVSQRSRSWKQHLTSVQVDVLQAGEAQLIVDPYGRVHSPVSNMRRVVRPALRIWHQPLAEVDLVSSQPLIVVYVAGKLAVGDWSLAQVQRLGTKGEVDNPFDGIELTPWSTRPPADVLDLKTTCEERRFYETIGTLWGLPDATQRQRVKRLVFTTMLFGPNVAGKPEQEAVRRKWPNVGGPIALIKKSDHGVLARAMQRLEAKVVIDGVVEAMRLTCPATPVLTLHDCLLVPPRHIDLAESILKTKFNELGLEPGLKVKAPA